MRQADETVTLMYVSIAGGAWCRRVGIGSTEVRKARARLPWWGRVLHRAQVWVLRVLGHDHVWILEEVS